jgi:NhaP-type Na+/H+ and K+/H+ antiporter
MSQSSEAQIRFNTAYLSLVIGGIVQGAAIVWYASQLNTKVLELGSKVDKLEINLRSETEKTAPVLFEYKFINSQLLELKSDIKEIKRSLDDKKNDKR